MIIDLVALFPRLKDSGYRRTSPVTTDYNCIAWAADRQDLWFWPDPVNGFTHWPDGIPCTETRGAFVALFESIGYEKCANGDPEAGFEKVAIYEIHGRPTHAARQLEGGIWTSKIGRYDDISHPLDALNGSEYGRPSVFMRRPKPVADQA